MSAPDPHVLPLEDGDPSIPLRDRPALAESLAAALRHAGYTYAGVGAAFAVGPIDREPAEVPYLLRRIPADGGLGTLTRLLMVGVPVDPADAERALAPVALDDLREAGLLADRPQGVAATLALVPSAEGLVASDWEREDRLPESAEHVMGLAVSSRTLARLVPRDPVGAVLDVGTGGGVQAILAARHATRVVATDANPRALAMARLGARLNGVSDRVELRRGDIFGPVAGERFDLVLANLPYVISPETTYLFRDGGRGEGLSRDTVRAAPAHIADDGLAILMIGWTHAAAERPWDAIRPWAEGLGCDALVIHHSSVDALDHAAGWNRHHWRDPAAVAAGIARWTAHLEALGAEMVAWGAIVLRRRPGGGDGWLDGVSLPVHEIGAAGDQVTRLLAARDLLAGRADAALLALPLVPAPDHALTQTLHLSGGEAGVESAVLAMRRGLRLRAELDEMTAGLLGFLDGRPLGDAIGALARAARADPAGLGRDLLPGVRRLVEMGLLVA